MINYIKNKIARHKAKKYITDGPVYGPSRIKTDKLHSFPHWITADTIEDAGIRQAVDIQIYVDGKQAGMVKYAHPSPYANHTSSVIVYDEDENGNAYLTDCEEFALKRIEGVVTYSVSLRA